MKTLLIALVVLGFGKEPALPKTEQKTQKTEACTSTAGAEDHGECHHPKPPADAKAPTSSQSGRTLARGDKLKGLPQVALTDLLKDPAKYDGKEVAVEAPVRKACSKMGCWMELGDKEGAGVRVTFKDYGFFVPLDSAGSKAKVEGIVKVAVLSDERAKHYESEGAKVVRDAQGKAKEVQLVAIGVELKKE